MIQYLINENSVVSQGVDLVVADMDGETVMLRIENGKYYGMDAVGSRIWELIEVSRSVSAVVGILTQEYEVERGQCQADVVEFIHYLHNEGLVMLG